jgi:two-component system, chemotaxis family, chemotaxis protein CheY
VVHSFSLPAAVKLAADFADEGGGRSGVVCGADAGMKILISDDDSTIRLLMRTLLQQKLGYEVVETTDGAKAWAAMDGGLTPDLCILDMWMPEMGGVDLIMKLRADARFARQKVMLCSSENTRQLILQAVALGISGYLLKPFVAQNFIEQVKKVCEGVSAAPPPEELEPVESVLTRLGIEKKNYVEMLGVFTKDVTALVADLRAATTGQNLRPIETRLNGLRGAAKSLGATSVVTIIERLERITSTGEPTLLRSGAQSLESQNDKVVAAMAALASQEPPVEEKLPEDKSKAVPSGTTTKVKKKKM